MQTWSREELCRIAEADDLHISPLREDGMTSGTPTWIWSVAVGDGALGHGAARNSRRHSLGPDGLLAAVSPMITESGGRAGHAVCGKVSL